MSEETPRAQRILLGTLAVAFCLGVWEVLGRTDALGHDALPPITLTVATLFDELGTGALWSPIGHTLVQWAIGLLGAIVVAIPLGLFLGSGRLRHRSTRSTIDFLRTIPPVMLLPLFVLVWGTGLKMVVLLAIYAAVWPMLTQTISGVRQLDEATLDTARIFHIGRRRRFSHVLLPAVSPYVTSGVRVSAVISLFIAVVCELVAGSPGLGQVLANAQLGGDTRLMWAVILTTGVLGVLINAVFRTAEGRLLVWHPAYAKQGS
jgi:ABC-type nitrate/sulfonate/bicarbonate transport system permease component